MTATEPLAIRIRPATARDNVLLSEIGAETFFDAFGPANTPEDMEMYLRRSFGPEIQVAELADPDTRFLIAEVGAETVGYARLRMGKAPDAIHGARPIEIVRVYARSRWIGRKVGAALMAECLKAAARMGCDTIWLDVWEKNERARAFYARWGFVEIGAQPFHLGTDIQNDLLMQRPVSLEGAGRPEARSAAAGLTEGSRRMSTGTLRILLVVLNAFLGLTAIAGGVGLVADINAPPLADLAGSPFRDYTIPGLSLLVIVGGISVAAAVMLLRRHRNAAAASGAAGVVVIGFEVVEVLVIGSPEGIGRTLQVFYFSLGALILLVSIVYAAVLRRSAAGG